MAIHAGPCGRGARVGRTLNAGMTVAAVNAFISHVVLVTELYGLIPGDALVRDIGGPRHDEYAGQRQASENARSQQTKPCKKIRTTVKDLCHVSVALGQKESPEES